MTIAEIAKKYGLTTDTLRYYERIGLIPAIKRNENGVRNYSEEDGNWVEFIKCMRSAGVQIEALVEYVALFQQGESTHSARKQILIAQRDHLIERIAEMQSFLERLNSKIENYDLLLVPAQKKLTQQPNKRIF
ncbi:MAG: MerR family transcriptional regulator [Planctomycetaceae bacterium]|jgi:DNA-binding transcriptional MerR regulator|nr:MerR family transcriptional regulator [Planctomycetaceae bacterium]